MTPLLAEEAAIAIFLAAGYAEFEALLFKAFASRHAKGFGKDLSNARGVVTQVRNGRQPLPEYVDAFFGFNTQQPIVAIGYSGLERIQVSPGDARHHAAGLLRACEAAMNDAYWLAFGMEQLALSTEEAMELLSECRLFKDRLGLEMKL
jgi:hypothetical protein